MAKATNKSLTSLRNGVPQNLSREEIRFAQLCFSQFGEDLAVGRWVERLQPGSHIYVDVGCFHPIHCSNTLLLHKQGWKGVNIDLEADKIRLFQQLRPNDYNVTAAVSSSERKLRLFRYEGGLTDRLGNVEDTCLESVIGCKPLSSAVISTQTLNRILESAPWPIPQIGYLNIDCEGHDLEVFKGLDLQRYQPVIITIEAFTQKEEQETRNYLETNRYLHKETIYKTLLYVAH